MAKIKTIAAGHTHSDGLCIGDAATSKLAFNGATPVTRPASANQGAIGAATYAAPAAISSGAGTGADGTSPSGAQHLLVVADVTAVRTALIALAADVATHKTLVNQLRAELVTLGLIKGAA